MKILWINRCTGSKKKKVDLVLEVSLVYLKSGVGYKRSVNVIYSLIWDSGLEILCPQKNVLVFILDSENVRIHRRVIQS